MQALMRTRLVATLSLAALLTAAGQSAYASVGVGIQADPVRLGSVAHPGGTYTLPSLYVVNTGTEPESLSFQVERLSSGTATGTTGTTGTTPETGHLVSPSWIQISSLGAQLAPGKSAEIALKLTPPGDAKAGSYSSDIVVTGSNGTVTSGDVRFGAAAATGLEFSIVPNPPSGIPAWRWWAVAALIVIAGIYFTIRRTGFRIRIETRGPHA
jgi:hypothetical protein